MTAFRINATIRVNGIVDLVDSAIFNELDLAYIGDEKVSESEVRQWIEQQIDFLYLQSVDDSGTFLPESVIIQTRVNVQEVPRPEGWPDNSNVIPFPPQPAGG